MTLEELGHGLDKLPPEARRKIDAEIHEIVKLQRAGKRATRRFELVLKPLWWESVELTKNGEQFSYRECLPSEKTVADWEASYEPTPGRTNARAEAADLMVYNSACTFGAPCVFDVSLALCERLFRTDVGAAAVDAKPPLPGFYVELPKGVLQFTGDIRRPDVTFVGVADVGSGLMVTAFSECQYAAVCMIVRPGTDHAAEAGSMRLFGEPTDARALENFVINFCLWLSSPSPDIQPTNRHASWDEVIDEIEHHDGKRTSVAITRGKHFCTWLAGNRTSRLRVLAHDVLVRGHWRKQAHGKGRTLRKVIWIEPHVRLPTGESVPGHDYDAR